MLAELTGLIISYNGKDERRINHALKVLSFSRLIAEKEQCEEDVVSTVCYTAIFHDIGIHNAK